MTEMGEDANRPNLASRLKGALREATRHVVTPGRVNRAWMEAYDRVAAVAPEISRARELFETFSKAAGVSMFTADIAAAAVAAYVSIGKGKNLQTYRREHSLDSLRQSLPRFRNLLRIHAASLNIPIEGDLNNGSYRAELSNIIAQKLWRREQTPMIASVAGFGGAAGAILAGQPIARASMLAARTAGSLGERVARRMQEIKTGALTL